MQKLFSTSCLSRDENGERVLQEYQGGAQPGQSFPLEKGENLLLAGGFPSLFPDSSIPLSPTLQLNRDCTELAGDALQRIAEAEYNRLQSQNYASYRLDADYRVCVIADHPTLLDDFLATYGGVLEIEPLLSGSLSDRYTTVSAVECERDGEAVKVRYRKRSPLQAELCTYCGECGKSCPEKCISSSLEIDFKRCTFCLDCEKVCKTEALDINGIEEISLYAPAVILLGEVEIERKDDVASVYDGSQIKEFFRSIYTAEIEEVVCHNNHICQYSGRLEKGCGRCIASCPFGAIKKVEGQIAIDHHLCEDCGECISICPTGALQNGNFDDASLLGYLGDVGPLKNLDLVLGSEKELHNFWWLNRGEKRDDRFYLEYPNIHCLSSAHLLFFYAAGFRRVLLLHEKSVKTGARLDLEVNKANLVTAELFLESFVSFNTTQQLTADSGSDREHPVSEFLPIPGKDSNKRALLSKVIQHLLVNTEKTIGSVQVVSDFHTMICNEQNCTQCLACLGECKTGALQSDGDSFHLLYDASMCVGCGICVGVCPEKVLSLDNPVYLDRSYFDTQVLAKADPARCSSCGAIFGTRKSLERVMKILSDRETVDLSHFELCSECRVVKLFETHGA